MNNPNIPIHLGPRKDEFFKWFREIFRVVDVLPGESVDARQGHICKKLEHLSLVATIPYSDATYSKIQLCLDDAIIDLKQRLLKEFSHQR